MRSERLAPAFHRSWRARQSGDPRHLAGQVAVQVVFLSWASCAPLRRLTWARSGTRRGHLASCLVIGALGNAASMVLLGNDPLQEVRNAQQLEGVLLRGEYFDRAALDQLLVEARDQ